MNSYEICESSTGQSLGVYQGDNEREAIEACCRDAGYESIAHAEAVLERPCTLVAYPAHQPE